MTPESVDFAAHAAEIYATYYIGNKQANLLCHPICQSAIQQDLHDKQVQSGDSAIRAWLTPAHEQVLKSHHVLLELIMSLVFIEKVYMHLAGPDTKGRIPFTQMLVIQVLILHR